MDKPPYEYKGEPARLSLYGFSSCTTSEDIAVSYANSDASKGLEATLYNIHWKLGTDCCSLLDNSKYPEEKEVLITDGMVFQVLSVERKFHKGKHLVIISLEANVFY